MQMREKVGESRNTVFFPMIYSFLMLSTSKNEEVSQNCFVFDVVKLKYQNSFVFKLADRQVDR